MVDSVEQAHLARQRGDFDSARAMIEDLLARDPANREAMVLRDEIEREIVDRRITEEAKKGWLDRLETSPAQGVGLFAAGVALLCVAAYLGVGPIKLAMRGGLFTRVKHPIRGGFHATFPVHFFFAGPVV